MARFSQIALAVLTLEAVFAASPVSAGPQTPGPSAAPAPSHFPSPPPGTRVVPESERRRWFHVIEASGLRPFLNNLRWCDPGYCADAISVDALITHLNQQVFDGIRGLYRMGWLHRKHRDIGRKRLDYRSDRDAFGPGSLQVVVSRHSGGVFIDMDDFSPYEDVRSFIGHFFEVWRHQFSRR